MNKRALVTVVITGSLFTAPLFAASFFHKLMDGKQPVHKSIKAHVKKEGQNYTDFSGNWAGACILGDEEIPAFLTLENDDTNIAIYDESLEIGPLLTSSTSNSTSIEFEHTSLEWSEDMSVLIIKEVSVHREHSPFPHNTPNPIETFSRQTTFSLNNEQLVIKGRNLNLVDMKKVGTIDSYSCTFSKDQD